jgi:hypothetical protein
MVCPIRKKQYKWNIWCQDKNKNTELGETQDSVRGLIIKDEKPSCIQPCIQPCIACGLDGKLHHLSNNNKETSVWVAVNSDTVNFGGWVEGNPSAESFRL